MRKGQEVRARDQGMWSNDEPEQEGLCKGGDNRENH